MKELSFERMEDVNGGMSCGWAIGIGIFSGAAIIGATIINPGIWAVPQTWYAASALVGGNAVNIGESCAD